MSYVADVVVIVRDDANAVISTTEVSVEFDAPDDPRALLAGVALQQATEDAQLAARVLWQ